MTNSNDVLQDAVNYDLMEFIKGQQDCANGVAHDNGSDSYNAGYSAQYQLEEIMGHKYGR